MHTATRGERGQAIVLIALMLTVLIGMAAIGIDGGRAYALRRDLQAAVDSSALAAADNLQQSGSYVSAEQAATANFASNIRQYAAPACSPYGTPGASSWTVTCTYADGTVLTDVAQALGPQGSQFILGARRSLQLQFARILTSGASPTVAASATGNVNNLLYSPAVSALSQAGCGGAGGTAITIGGGGALSVNGDFVSNGSIAVSGSLRVAGDIYARCQSTVAGAVTNKCYPSGASSPCSYPDVAGATRAGFRLADPNYPAPVVTGGSQGRPGDDVVLSPGSYPTNPAIGANRCYFLSAGVYAFANGYTNNAGFVSNELKPPDEARWTNNTQLANPQFWNTNGVNCAGAFQFDVQGGGPPMGTWGFELTSARSDTYAGTSYQRESAPSRCQALSVHSFQDLNLQVSNVPGATAYNIYLSSNGCSGPFGLVRVLPVTGPVQNDNTCACPFSGNGNCGNGNGSGTNQGNGNNGNGNNNTCSLGMESTDFVAATLPTLPLPNMFALPGTAGAYPPDGETAPLQNGLPNQNPDRASPPSGDRANENQCVTTPGVAAVCPAAVTPGAVALSISSGGCLNASDGGDNFVFSGYQYNWLALYEPGAGHPPANTCGNVIGAAGNSAWVGLVYAPAATVTVTSSWIYETEATGGVIAAVVLFSGGSPSITYSSSYAPAPPASRLTG